MDYQLPLKSQAQGKHTSQDFAPTFAVHGYCMLLHRCICKQKQLQNQTWKKATANLQNKMPDNFLQLGLHEITVEKKMRQKSFGHFGSVVDTASWFEEKLEQTALVWLNRKESIKALRSRFWRRCLGPVLLGFSMSFLDLIFPATVLKTR